MDFLSNLNNCQISKSLYYLKQNKSDSAIQALGITKQQAEKYDYIGCLIALEEGLNLLFSGHHSQSVAPLRKAISLINISNDDKAKVIIPVLADFAEGISLLLQGNTHGATKLFELNSNTIQRLNFFQPECDKFLLSNRIAAEIAVARSHMNIGDIPLVESCFGNIIQHQEKLLSKLDETNKEDIPLFNEIFGTRLEFSLIFMRLELEVLDFDALVKRIKFTQKNIELLNGFITKAPQNPIKEVLEIFKILYEIFEIYSRIGKNIILERLPLTKTEINELLSVEKKTFEARQKANNAGDRGKPLLYTINQLEKINNSFFKIGKAHKTDFGRLSGLITLCSLVTLHLTIRPNGDGAIIYFLGEIIVSLIVGFGYGAIKFKSLLGIYSDKITKIQ